MVSFAKGKADKITAAKLMIPKSRSALIIAVVPQRELVAAEALGGGVQDAATQAGAQRAVRRARRELVRHHRVGRGSGRPGGFCPDPVGQPGGEG